MNADKLKESFPLFLVYVWRYLSLPDPTPAQNEIAHWLQHGGRRIGIKAFRGIGKSWITSAYVVWLLWRAPDTKILVVSASKERSDSFSIFTKRLIKELSVTEHLTPEPRLGDRSSNVAFDVRGAGAAHAPSVKSVGITGQITGSRADYIIIDDAEVVNNSETAAQREKLRGLIAELGGAVLTPESKAGKHGGMIFLGTPQVEDSIYNHLPEAGYTFRTWTAEVPDSYDKYDGTLAPSIVKLVDEGRSGEPTDPSRFDSQELAERRLEYGRIGYTLQFMLDTSLSDEDRHPLKLRDLIVAQTDVDICPERFVWGSGEDQELPQYPLVGLTGDRFFKPLFTEKTWSPYEGSILYIDPSGRGKDLTGYAVVKALHGMLVIRKWGGLAGGYEEKTLAQLASIAKEEKVNTVVIESNFGDGMYAQLIRPVLNRVYPEGCGVEDDHVIGAKEARIIDNLEPALASHRIVIDESVVAAGTSDRSNRTDPDAVFKTPFYQLTRITKDKGCLKYDDLIDALAGAVRYWTERMARDVDVEVSTRESERFDEDLENFMNGVNLNGENKAPLPPTFTEVQKP